MLHLRALAVVLVLFGLLSIPIYMYWTSLTKGMSPPPSTLLLDKMEKSGVPPIELEDLRGHTVKLSDFSNQVVIVNFWASWCAPCVKEFPSLRRLAQGLQGKLTVVAISNDSSRPDLDSFLKVFGDMPPNFVVLWDPNKRVATEYGTEVLPESYIIGRDSRLIRKVIGVDKWDTPMALKFFSEVVSPGG